MKKFLRRRTARVERPSWGRSTRTFAVASVMLMLAQCGPTECAPPPGGGGPEGVVYLTFDDGPSGYTESMLDVLGRHGASATFFVLGREIGGRESTLAATSASGHAIGNHTWSHPDLRKLSDNGVRDQINWTNDAIAAVTGRPSSCVRPPYGFVSERVRSVISGLGMSMVLWSIDTNDWDDSVGVASIKRELDKAGDGSVIVMHDGGGNQSRTVRAVDEWLAANAGRFHFHALPNC